MNNREKSLNEAKTEYQTQTNNGDNRFYKQFCPLSASLYQSFSFRLFYMPSLTCITFVIEYFCSTNSVVFDSFLTKGEFFFRSGCDRCF